MPKYDCIISLVVYNPNLEILAQAIDSVASTKLSVLINIVDNSPGPSLSTDFLSRFSTNNMLYHYNNGNNIGFGSAHNLTLNKYLHETEYFLILNPDIYYDKNNDVLGQLKQKLDEDPSIGLAIPKIYSEDGSIQYVNKKLPSPIDLLLRVLSNYFKFLNSLFEKKIDDYLLKNLDFSKNIICPGISGCFMFIRARVIAEVGGFDERYFLYMEDTDLSYKISLKYNTVIFNDIYITHLWQRGAYKKLRLFSYLLRSGIKYFNKWGWFFDKSRSRLNKAITYY